MQAVGSGQTAAGTFKLFASISNGANTLPLAVNHSSYLDNGTAYTAEIYTSLVPINKENPTAVSVLKYLAIERNNRASPGTAIYDIKLLTDEDYTLGTYITIFANEQEPANRTNGNAWSRSGIGEHPIVSAGVHLHRGMR